MASTNTWRLSSLPLEDWRASKPRDYIGASVEDEDTELLLVESLG